MKKKIILLGGAGYIGRVLTDFFLKKNFSVVSIDNLIYSQKKPPKKKNFKFFNLNINNKRISKLIKKGDTIILLAGLVGDPITKKYPKKSKKINEKYLSLCIDASIKNNVKHIIFVSTCSNYGVTKNNQLVNEHSNLNPISLYAKSKIRIENYLKINSKKFQNKITILRFATAFGLSKRMRFDLTINQFVRSIFLKNELQVYDSSTWRPYCHVNDFAESIYKVMTFKNLKNFDIFNVGSNKNNFTKKNIVNKIGKYLNINKVKFTNKSQDLRNYKVDFSKINKTIGFKPKYNVDFGIKEIIIKMKKKKFKNLKNSNDYFGNYKIK